MEEIIMNPETMTMFLFQGTFLMTLLILIVLGIVLVLTIQTSARSRELKKEFKILDGEIDELFKMSTEHYLEVNRKINDECQKINNEDKE